ncbi:MAG: hypothetical protein QXJ28_02470 [Candidatus Pacearchaeota archaeon]
MKSDRCEIYEREICKDNGEVRFYSILGIVGCTASCPYGNKAEKATIRFSDEEIERPICLSFGYKGKSFYNKQI